MRAINFLHRLLLSTSNGNGLEPAEHVLVAGSQGSAHHVVETSARRTRIAFLQKEHFRLEAKLPLPLPRKSIMKN